MAKQTAFFFFQAEDGIRDPLVTGVQTCALPISTADAVLRRARPRRYGSAPAPPGTRAAADKAGRTGGSIRVRWAVRTTPAPRRPAGSPTLRIRRLPQARGRRRKDRRQCR